MKSLRLKVMSYNKHMVMDKFIISALLCMIFVPSVYTQEQQPATEAGEDFDLYGVISLFEDAKDLEDFEKKINSEDNDVNNLDLNKNEEVDMVKVVEYVEDNTHLLVLQAVLGENDFQDVATIEIEKHAEDEISLQVIGDPDIYGPDYILEPAPEEGSIRTYAPSAVFVSVHLWSPVRVIFRPGRAVFVSTVVWMPRPVWFRPWRPIPRTTWRNRYSRWHSPRWRHTRTRQSVRGRNMYSPRRRTSPMAKNNFGPKPTPNKSPATSPGPNQKKQTKPNQQKKRGNPNQKKKRGN